MKDETTDFWRECVFASVCVFVCLLGSIHFIYSSIFTQRAAGPAKLLIQNDRQTCCRSHGVI